MFLQASVYPIRWGGGGNLYVLSLADLSHVLSGRSLPQRSPRLTSSGGHLNGLYVSYFNAFLLNRNIKNLNRNLCSKIVMISHGYLEG